MSKLLRLILFLSPIDFENMAKSVCEDYNSISISFLKKYDYFCGRKSGSITWSRGGNPCGGISITVTTEEYFAPIPNMQLSYIHTDWLGEKTELDYQVQITTTPCHFGNKRYWFICPLIKNGQRCGRRIGTLYGGKYFGCRQCHELSYRSQRENYNGIWNVLGISLYNDFEAQEKAIRVKYWKGEPTKRYARLLRKMARAKILFHRNIDKVNKFIGR